MSWIVYVLRSESRDIYYKGCCIDFDKRLQDHNYGRVNSTKSGRPWTKHYTEEFADKTEALKRERFFKTRSGYRWLKKNSIT